MATKMFYQCSYCGITERTDKTTPCTKCGDLRKKLSKRQTERSYFYGDDPDFQTKPEEKTIDSEEDLSEYLSRIYGGYSD